MKPSKLLLIATGVAIGRIGMNKYHRLGAAGVRADGVIVASFNGNPEMPQIFHHAESRLAKKLTPKSVVAVVRVNKQGQWQLAKPCHNCQVCMERVGVKKVYYSISPGEYAILSL